MVLLPPPELSAPSLRRPGVCSSGTCEVCCGSPSCRSGFVRTFEILRAALCVCSTGRSCLKLKFWGKSGIENRLLTCSDKPAHHKPLLFVHDSFASERFEVLHLPHCEFLTLGRGFNLILVRDCSSAM